MNPGGQFLFVKIATGMEISVTLAHALVQTEVAAPE
jgi:hypothetical protein